MRNAEKAEVGGGALGSDTTGACVQKCHCSRLGYRCWGRRRRGAAIDKGSQAGKRGRVDNWRARRIVRKRELGEGAGHPAGFLDWVPGFWRAPGHRASGQQRCLPVKDAVPVRAERAAYQAATSGRERPLEASGGWVPQTRHVSVAFR